MSEQQTVNLTKEQRDWIAERIRSFSQWVPCTCYECWYAMRHHAIDTHQSTEELIRYLFEENEDA